MRMLICGRKYGSQLSEKYICLMIAAREVEVSSRAVGLVSCIAVPPFDVLGGRREFLRALQM
jgi:hypothetical protein